MYEIYKRNLIFVSETTSVWVLAKLNEKCQRSSLTRLNNSRRLNRKQTLEILCGSNT